jgi:hypothetical protein
MVRRCALLRRFAGIPLAPAGWASLVWTLLSCSGTMSQPTVLFLRLDQRIRGPFTPELLAELAQSGVITPATDASPDATGPWMPLQTLGDYAGMFPPRPAFQFRTKPFEHVNHASDPAVDLRTIIAAANRPPPPPATADSPRPAKAPPHIDVAEILRENARIQACFEKPVDLTPRPNRRRLDYLILMIVVNGFLVWRLIAGWGNPVTMLYSVSGLIVFSVGITWVMYGVMDRY